MDFDVSIEEPSQAYSVISVRGEVDLHTAPKVEYAIERAAKNEGASAVVVDMSNITFIDSTALSMFARAKRSLDESGMDFRIAEPSSPVERIFSVTGFRDYFEIFETREQAAAG